MPRIARGPAPTAAQRLARRNDRWLRLYEVGLPDPVTGRTRPLSAAEIAELCDRSTRRVQEGLAEARRVRRLARG